MSKVATRLLVVLFLFSLVPLVSSRSAGAQMREFTGKIDEVNASKKFRRKCAKAVGGEGDYLIAGDRSGQSKLLFCRVEGTTLEGEKTSWDDLKKKDWLVISWKFVDNPRKAYKVVVIPDQDPDD